MPGLRDILDAATPGPWVADEALSEPGELHNVWRAQGSGYVAVAHDITEFADVRLIALAPELAALVLDMGEFIRNVCDTTNEWESSLLARLDQLGKEPSDG